MKQKSYFRVELKKVGLGAEMQAPAAGPSDYIYVTFRCLSAAVIEVNLPMKDAQGNRMSGVLDLTTPGVLEAAVKLLPGIVVYPDHEKSVKTWLGLVERAWWSVADAGLTAPGIDLELKIDAVANPKIARGLTSDPPMISAGSLGFDYEFTKSHPRMSDAEFWVKQGAIVDGQMVRMIATAILAANEFSLVWAGADPDAIKLDNVAGPLPAQAAAEAADKPARRGQDPDAGAGKEQTMRMSAELASRMKVFLGKDAPEDLAEREDTAALELALTHGELLRDRLASVTVELDKVRPQASEAVKMLDAKRAEVRRLAALCELGKAEGDLPLTVAKGIEGLSTFAELEQAQKEFAAQAEKKFPAKCPKCGTTAERRSSLEAIADQPQKQSVTAERDRGADSLFGVAAK
jgi:hypothetical protein